MQGFIIPELIIESVIRDGLQNVRADKTILDSIFAQLTRAYNTQKYGTAEIAKIKALVDRDIAVLYSYNEVDAKDLAITIMVGSDNESKPRAHLGDLYEEVQEQIADPVELQALHRVDNLNVTGFDPLTGKVSVTDAMNLANVYHGMIYVDSAGTEHDVLGGIVNVNGSKGFLIGKQDEVDFSTATGYIKSSLNFKQYEVKGVSGDVNLVIGCHAKDALTAKYLYVLVKYFILSRKPDLIKRCFYLASYSGSDFNRDSSYVGDRVYTRFLMVTGKVDDTWRSDQVQLIDNIEVTVIPVD
jgi:hypothetical protein